MAHTTGILLLGLVLAAAGYEAALDPASIAQALAIGQSRIEATRVRFHQPYRVAVGLAPVDYIEVVTPFRRVELAAEARARAGERRFGHREARATLATARGELELFVELTFHPLNTYLGVPPYDVTLARADASAPPIEPRVIERVPRHGARIDGRPLPYPVPGAPRARRGSEPLLGGTVIAAFESLPDRNGTYEVVISESGKAIARARLELASVR